MCADKGAGQAEGSTLRQSLGLRHAVAMVVGTIIGASIFVQPSEVTGQMGSIAGVFVVWAIAGALTMFGALVCAELASTFPRSGGVYVYLKEAYSPSVGFLWGWAMFWSVHSGIIAVVSMVFARYVGYLYPLTAVSTRVVAVVAIVVLSAVNCVGVRAGSRLQTLLTAGKMLAIALMIALGVTLGSALPSHFQSAGSAVEVLPGSFFLALIAGLFAFGGWHMVTYNAGETVEPETTIPRALMLGTAIVTLTYLALNVVYLYILPLDAVASSSRVAADAADAVWGSGGGAFMAGLVVFSTFGALSGIILAGPRVYYAMARDGLLFGWFGSVHPRTRVPVRAIVLQGVWSAVLVLTGTYRELFVRVIYTEWLFFGLMAVGLFILRRRPDVERGYSVWGYPVVPAIFALAAFAIVVQRLVASPAQSASGLLLVLLGLPVYFVFVRPGARRGT